MKTSDESQPKAKEKPKGQKVKTCVVAAKDGTLKTVTVSK